MVTEFDDRSDIVLLEKHHGSVIGCGHCGAVMHVLARSREEDGEIREMVCADCEYETTIKTGSRR